MSTYRRLQRARPNTLRLWTLQPLAVWDALERHGTLLVDPTSPEFDPDYIPPYDWMRQQMAQRVVNYAGGYPWWGYEEKPDLRQMRFWRPVGEPFVRLELAIEPDRVLLSGYGDWHFVLNDWYLSLYEMRDTDGQVEWVELEIPPEHPTEAQRAQSWERIFDMDRIRQTNTIQACWERLDLRDVISITKTVGAGRDVVP